MTDYALNEYGTLEWFRKSTGVPPWEFWGFKCSDCCRETCKSCKESGWSEFNWQNGRVARDDVKQAVRQARELLEQVTCYPAGDQYRTETVSISGWSGNACDFSTAELCHPVKALGVQQVTSLGLQDVVYLEADRATPSFESDENGEACTRPMWFVVEFDAPAEALADGCVYQIHVPEPERWGDVSQDSFVFWDHMVTDDETGVIQLWGRPWQLGKPTAREAADCCPIDCNDPENFLEQVELITVCHVECGTDTETACITLLEDSHPCKCCGCCGESADGRIGAARLKSGGKHGRIEILNTVYNADLDSWSCCSCICKPDAVQVRYLAGRHDCREVADLLAPLAAGLLPTICEYRCGQGSNLLEKYMQDFTIDSQGDTTLNVPFEFNNNPFGFTYGAGLAYQRLMKLPGFKRPVAIAL